MNEIVYKLAKMIDLSINYWLFRLCGMQPMRGYGHNFDIGRCHETAWKRII